MSTRRLFKIARGLEQAVIALAVIALGFRAMVHPHMPRPAGENYGAADVIDFALALLLFALSCACSVSGVMLTTRAAEEERARAYRPALIGMTTFVVYYLVHPYVAAAS